CRHRHLERGSLGSGLRGWFRRGRQAARFRNRSARLPRKVFQWRSGPRHPWRAGDETAMVVVRPSRKLELAFISIALILLATAPALAQQGSVLTTLENSVVTAAKGWETTVMNAARSLFWILAGIEIGIAAVWLAI